MWLTTFTGFPCGSMNPGLRPAVQLHPSGMVGSIARILFGTSKGTWRNCSYATMVSSRADPDRVLPAELVWIRFPDDPSHPTRLISWRWTRCSDRWVSTPLWVIFHNGFRRRAIRPVYPAWYHQGNRRRAGVPYNTRFCAVAVGAPFLCQHTAHPSVLVESAPSHHVWLSPVWEGHQSTGKVLKYGWCTGRSGRRCPAQNFHCTQSCNSLRIMIPGWEASNTPSLSRLLNTRSVYSGRRDGG